MSVLSYRKCSLLCLSLLIVENAFSKAPLKSSSVGIGLARQVAASAKQSMRVKIFPHDRDYKPHGRDLVRDKVALESSQTCEVFEARAGFVAPQSSVFLYAASKIDLSASELHAPVWIFCPESVLVKRGASEPQFRYPGSMYAHAVLSSKGSWELELINVVDLEEYVKGVVPSEVYAGWKMETLKTQAIAARTYAVYHKRRARNQKKNLQLWDVDDTIKFQAYTGLSLRTQRTNTAVDATSGVIITHRGRVIQAYYHADSGGQTEAASQVWKHEIPYTVAQKEWFSDDKEHEPSRWTRRIRVSRLVKRLKRLGYAKGSNKLVKLVVPVAARTNSGRVRYVLTVYADKSHNIVPIDEFKKAMGGLPSTLFHFQDGGDTSLGFVKLMGKGRGHGVGLSQNGAEFLASKYDWPFDAIIRYYYSNTNLCRLYKKKAPSASSDLPVCS